MLKVKMLRIAKMERLEDEINAFLATLPVKVKSISVTSTYDTWVYIYVFYED